MAVIRPLTNTPDPHSCKPSTRDLGTDPHLPQEPPGAKPLYNLAEEDDDGDLQRPLWNPACSGQTQRLESDLDRPASYLPPHLASRTTDRMQGAVVDTHSSNVPALNDHSPANKPLSLTPSHLPLVPHVGAFEEQGPEDEDLDLLHSYIYNAKGEEEYGEDVTHNKPTLEDSLALSPPSPFRDSVCSGESVSGSPSLSRCSGVPRAASTPQTCSQTSHTAPQHCESKTGPHTVAVVAGLQEEEEEEEENEKSLGEDELQSLLHPPPQFLLQPRSAAPPLLRPQEAYERERQ
ncbi:unnamed protein product [Pleuronectes platessa]|uniref:Metabotropic glutamate receptor Homer-binding domain-containing protein n=1 Tax=Pleuronectes platessa TaxID=8262 RepID=A0A9N7UUY9_PLEPL|nr:unnamed protein product [Pleuronectes platessa]